MPESSVSSPSISALLPWYDYDDESCCFLLADGRSIAGGLVLSDVGCEAKSASFLESLRLSLQGIFQDVFEGYHDQESPWVLQFYSYRRDDLSGLRRQVRRGMKAEALGSAFSSDFMSRFGAHCDWMTGASGVFEDTRVTGLPFRGGVRETVVVFYRRLGVRAKLSAHRSVLDDVVRVRHALLVKFAESGVGTRVLVGASFHAFLVRWFNPRPAVCDGDVEALLRVQPFLPVSQRPFGVDLAESVFYSAPVSDVSQGVWLFDGLPHRYLPLVGMSSLPVTGHVFLPRSFGSKTYSLFDTLPVGAVFAMTVVMRSQVVVKKHLQGLLKGTEIAKGAEGALARWDAERALRVIEEGNYLLPTCMGVYLRGEDKRDLDIQTSQVSSLLTNHGFRVVKEDDDVVGLDNYLRFLPMNYDYTFERRWLTQSRHLSAVSLSKLLPCYGRDRGSGHPGFMAFNRGGEPFLLDPLDPRDKSSNSHQLILGTTGSGKSALAIYQMMSVMALRRPRLIAIDAGNSFEHLASHFESRDVRVYRVSISHDWQDTVSLNPFADSERLLQQVRAHKAQQRFFQESSERLASELADLDKPDAKDSDTSPRDFMGEMVLACSLMITGCDPTEKPISRVDKRYIMEALVMAAETAEASDLDGMLPSDVAASFVVLAQRFQTTEDTEAASRVTHMARSIEVFCQDPLTARYFNQRGKPWPDADFTLFELGLFKDSDEYTAQRTLAFVTLMNRAVSTAEYYQHQDTRDTIFVGDECHLLLQNVYSAAALTRCSKMSRKIGLWLWLLSQNIADFSRQSRKMLSMIEFIFCLWLKKDEINQLAELTALSEEDKLLLHAVKKEPGKYVEGVVLSDKVRALFRNVPMRLSLALAMTEKAEKAELAQLAQEKGCSLLEAIYHREQQLLGKPT